MCTVLQHLRAAICVMLLIAATDYVQLLIIGPWGAAVACDIEHHQRRRIVEVGDLCDRNMITIGERASLVDAAQVMRTDHVGFLVVTEPVPEGHDAKVLGVLTDRDIVTAVIAKGAEPATLTVGDVMGRYPIMVSEAHTLGHALRLMREAGVRRVPVLGNRDQLVGVLSIDDVLEALSNELGDVSQAIRKGQLSERRTRP